MVTDHQVRRLKKLMQTEKGQAALKASVSAKTARKYMRSGQLPGEMKKERDWKARENPLEGVREDMRDMLFQNPGLEAKTVFEHLQKKHPGLITYPTTTH